MQKQTTVSPICWVPSRASGDEQLRAVRTRVDTILSGRRAVLKPLLERMLDAPTPDRETCDRTCRLCDLAACPQDRCPVEQATRDRDR